MNNFLQTIQKQVWRSLLVLAVVLTGGLFVFTQNSLRAYQIPNTAQVTIVDNGYVFGVEGQDITVAEMLTQLGYEITENDLIYPDRADRVTMGTRIYIYRSNIVTLLVDGQTNELTTHARTVEDLLNEQKIALGSSDRVRPALTTLIHAYDKIEVIRVATKEVTKEEALKFSTQQISDNTLALGTTKVKQAGVEGKVKRTYVVTYENGREISRKIIKEEIIKEPVKQIVLVGTKISTVYVGTGQASHYGYDFTNKYCSSMCAAHRTLPFGSRVKVTNLTNGKSVIVTINDRGPWLPARIIDLGSTPFSKLAPLSQGIIKSVRLDLVK